MAKAPPPAYTQETESAPPPYADANSRTPVGNSATRTSRGKNIARKNLEPVWGSFARHPQRLEIATLLCALIIFLLGIGEGTNGHDGPWGSNRGLWVAAYLIFPLIQILHSCLMITLIRRSHNGKPKPPPRPTPRYAIGASLILLAMWVGQAVWWALLINAFAHPELFSDNTYAEDYMMGKGMFTAGIGFALILYISTSAWCIHSGEAGRCRTAKRTGTVVEDETRRNDDVELQSIDRPQRIRNSRG